MAKYQTGQATSSAVRATALGNFQISQNMGWKIIESSFILLQIIFYVKDNAYDSRLFYKSISKTKGLQFDFLKKNLFRNSQI